MTTPDRPVPDRVGAWQASMLRRVQRLATEHARIEKAGERVFDRPEIDGPPVEAWRTRLDELTTQREQAEHAAWTAGVPLRWIAAARELGATGALPRDKIPAPDMPARANQLQQWCVDMLAPDLWQMQHMAALSAAHADRVAGGRWPYQVNPAAVGRFSENMNALHERITALSEAAALTRDEGAQLWSSMDVHRFHAATVSGLTDHELATFWHRWAAADPVGKPPYLPQRPADASVQWARPPLPQQMVDRATLMMRAEFSDPAVEHLAPDGGGAQIGAAVEAMMPEGSGSEWDTDPTASAPATPGPEHGLGY
ncbi:hypothetical protein [Nocardia sputi]|uniref:hypothetical protein n=1 Tax=Nocardia sputi TaxID=2943705 RepID=UPI0020C03889|nr:hypothetical protein [Nocardia sputi]